MASVVVLVKVAETIAFCFDHILFFLANVQRNEKNKFSLATVPAG
jgi:hypothetical protein